MDKVGVDDKERLIQMWQSLLSLVNKKINGKFNLYFSEGVIILSKWLVKD